MKSIKTYNDFIIEAKEANEEAEVTFKVDNSGFVKILNWFKKNTDLFKPHNNGLISKESGVRHGDETERLRDAGMNVDFPYGYCYPVSQFVFYSLGGYKSDYDLKLIKSIKFKYKSINAGTTHWFVQHKTSGRIIDLTMEQFDGVLDIEELYPDARRANLGFPYYNVDGKKVKFDHTPPCFQVLALYDSYRKDVEKIPGLEKYWSAAKYATTRREDEAYSNLELDLIPLNERHCFVY